MKNFVQNGNEWEVAAPAGGVKSGDPVAVNGVVGVATRDAAEGTLLVVHLTGVVSWPAEPAAVFNAGDDLFLDVANRRVTKTAAGNVRCGWAWTAKAADTAWANVRLRNGVK